MSFVNTFSRIMDLVLGAECAEKLKIVLNVLLHEWHMRPPTLSSFRGIRKVTDEEIETVFHDMDVLSLSHIKRYVFLQRDLPLTDDTYGYFFFNYHRFFTQSERKLRKTMRRQYRRELKKYKCSDGVTLGYAESILLHRGPSVKEYIKNGIFVDAGSCFGDSALVFLKNYRPGKVIAFEPSMRNCEIFQSIMRMNKIPEFKYELVPQGLGKEETLLHYEEEPGAGNSLLSRGCETTQVKVTTLDNFCRERKLTDVKLIKADVEGMGLDMLLGAESVIRKNRPVLLLSIYHNKEELLGICDSLKKWDLDYRCMIRMLLYPLALAELTLIAWPRELEKADN